VYYDVNNVLNKSAQPAGGGQQRVGTLTCVHHAELLGFGDAKGRGQLNWLSLRRLHVPHRLQHA